ncbi:MAG: tetratricopeptide repeat protein [Sedimentisphaerales bacterium]|nr:tetratricopeptide repeat protein [Sedimentisphaerales bacterium]
MSSKNLLRSFLRRLLKPVVAVFATLLALLAAEGIVRVFSLAPGIKPIQLSSYDCIYKRSTNPILGFELKANCQSVAPDFIQTYERTNSHGQRDKERTFRKPDGVKRILLLGDSVVEGYGLRESQTISRQLEHLYSDGSTEVLNFGVSAYCTRAEIELLEVKGLQFDPDVVVLVFVENDFDNFNREAFPLGGTIERPEAIKALFQKSHFFRLASIRLNMFQFGMEADPIRWNKDAIGNNNVAEGLRRFRRLADRHDFQPLVAIWPRFLDDRITDVCFMPRDNEQLVVEYLAAMYNIPSVRLSEYFQQHRAKSGSAINPRLYYSSGDELHPSPEGARVVAEALKLILDGRFPSTHDIPRSAQSDTEALETAKALGRSQPNYARVYNRMGTELLKASKPEEAAAEFKKAIEADPTHAGAHNNLGAAYERLGREEAQAQYERAIQLEPDFTPAHFNLSRLLMKKRQAAEAIVELQRTIQVDPNHVGALNMLGMALGRQQKYAEAQIHLEKAVRLDPNHAEARNNLGAAYAGLGRLQEALEQFEAALRLDPDDIEARENLRRVKEAMPNQ